MKRNYKGCMMALCVAATLTACSESENLQHVNLSTDEIAFDASLNDSWGNVAVGMQKSPITRAIEEASRKGPIVVNGSFSKPLYLHTIIQDAALFDDDQQVQTRGNISTKEDLSEYSSIGVSALYQKDGAYTTYFENKEATKEPRGSWSIKDEIARKWPLDATVSFHAFAPYSNSMFTSTVDVNTVQSHIAYTADADVEKQPDLIVASATGKRSVGDKNPPIKLAFSHALTAVNFAISGDLATIIDGGTKLTKLVLEGVPNAGTLTLAAKDDKNPAAQQTWTLTQTNGAYPTGTYTFDLTDKNVVVGQDLALNDGNFTLMMIPQTLPADAKLHFTLNLKGDEQTFTIDLANQVWAPGAHVTYKLSANAVSSLDKVDVTFPDDWNAADIGYPKTQFEEGDAIGLYVVNTNGKLEEVNLKLTLGADGQWKTEAGKKFLKLHNYTYYAYYPYDAAIGKDEVLNHWGNLDFDVLFNAFYKRNKADQSTKDALLAQDLQFAQGVVSADASTLKFDMKHKVGLVVLNLMSKNVTKTRQFKDDTYRHYYHWASAPQPVENTNYVNIGTLTYAASDNFVDTKPFNVKSNKYLHITPFGWSRNFKGAAKASTQDVYEYKEWAAGGLWGYRPDENHLVIKEDIAPFGGVPEFVYLSHLFSYKGDVEEFTAPANGTYTLECWGAAGSIWIENSQLGKGGYSKGLYTIDAGKQIFVCVGNSGAHGTSSYNNNMGKAVTKGAPGGGATHMSINSGGELKTFDKKRDDVLLVAAGGGGVDTYPTPQVKGGYGGGSEGGDGLTDSRVHGTGATATAPGKTVNTSQYKDFTIIEAGFGFGGSGEAFGNYGGQGGGGWYGGGGCVLAGTAGGGSSYGNKKHITDYQTIPGNAEMPSPSGTIEIGHEGDGVAKITWKR